MDSERMERLETSLKEAHEKLDAVLKQLSDQTKPLKVMEDHVYNVESIATRVPLLSRFSIPFKQPMISERKDDAKTL